MKNEELGIQSVPVVNWLQYKILGLYAGKSIMNKNSWDERKYLEA